MSANNQSRPGMTLIELLVVMGIIAILVGLTAVMYASFGTSHSVSRGADQLTGMLLSARQMARRDNRPTGVQFIVIEDPTTKAKFCREVVYIQQPDDFAIGIYMGPKVLNKERMAWLRMDRPLTPNPTNPIPPTGTIDFPIQPGDYLECLGGGFTRQIVVDDFDLNDQKFIREDTQLVQWDNRGTQFYSYLVTLNPETKKLSNGTTILPGGVALLDRPQNQTSLELGSGANTNYRVIPQPRVIPNEASFVMPANIVIDFGDQTKFLPNTPLSNVVPRTVQGKLIYEVLFAPSGAVVGAGTSSGMITLWVRERNAEGRPDNTVDRFQGRPVLVTVQTRTGFVSSHPVSAGPDPYTHAKQARSSGM